MCESLKNSFACVLKLEVCLLFARLHVSLHGFLFDIQLNVTDAFSKKKKEKPGEAADERGAVHKFFQEAV